MFDTHCHLNFKAFTGRVDKVIQEAKKAGVKYFVVPGTDVETSKQAVKLAEKYPGVYAAVGIHPHHIYNYQSQISNVKCQICISNLKDDLITIEKLLKSPKVIAVGEVGLDKHYYQKTKYQKYQVASDFIGTQKFALIEQIKLAKKFKKSLIIHNRQAVGETLTILNDVWDDSLTGYCVFHCCEASNELLQFALTRRIYLGVDGDVTYDKKKQEFAKQIPLDLLVLETDSPFLTPEPLRSRQKQLTNEPKNLLLIAEYIAKIREIPRDSVIFKTKKNSLKLFRLL